MPFALLPACWYFENMALQQPRKVTLQVERNLLTRIKMYAVTHNSSFSNAVETAVRRIVLDDDRPPDFARFLNKYQHAGISNLRSRGRGRPPAEYLKKHGYSSRKKATFYFWPNTTNKMRHYAVNILRIDRSTFVNIAIKVFLSTIPNYQHVGNGS